MLLEVVVLAFEITVPLRWYQIFISLANISKAFNHIELVYLLHSWIYWTSLVNQLDRHLTMYHLPAFWRQGSQSTFCSSMFFNLTERMVRLMWRVQYIRQMAVLVEGTSHAKWADFRQFLRPLVLVRLAREVALGLMRTGSICRVAPNLVRYCFGRQRY